MSSKSDDLSSSTLEEESDEMEIDSDEELLNDDEEVENIKERSSERKKRSFDPRYALPTKEEKQMLRNADMDIEVSLIEMEMTEYFDDISIQHPCDENIKSFLKEVNRFISSLPEKEIVYDEKTLPGVFQRSIADTKTTKTFFKKPSSMYVIGSYSQHNHSPFSKMIDMTIEMPDSLLSERDIINWKYFNKRSLYLHHIMQSYHSAFPNQKIYYEYMSNDYDKPVGVITIPAGICACGCCVRLMVVPSMHVFDVGRLEMGRNNVHRGVVKEEEYAKLPATWYYNSMVLEDMLTSVYTTFIIEKQSECLNLQIAGSVLRKWVASQNLDKHVTGFLCSMLLCILYADNRIGNTTSVYAMLLIFFDFIARSDFVASPFHFSSNPSITAASSFIPDHVCLLIDDSYGYNLAYRLSESGYKEWRNSCRIACERIKGRCDTLIMNELFGKEEKDCEKYDLVIKLGVADLQKEDLYSKAEDFNYSSYVNVEQDIEVWLNQALEKRASSLRTYFPEQARWEIDQSCPAPKTILLVVKLNGDNISKTVDKGPAAKSEEAKAWLALWGNKTQLRRFKDGSILYTNVWEYKEGENYSVALEIIRYILSVHVMAVTKLTSLYAPLQSFIPAPLYHATTSLNTIYADLAKILSDSINENERNNGIDYNGHIGVVYPISPFVMGVSICDVEPSTYFNYSDGKGGKKEYSTARVIEIIAKIQDAKGLPSSLDTLQAVKTIWYTSITSILAKKKIECLLSEQYVDILYEGYAFRLTLFTDKEIDLSTKLHQVKSLSDQAYVSSMTAYAYKPSHYSILKNAALQNPAFIPALRLIKLWKSAHGFVAIPDTLLDILMVYVFEKPSCSYHPITAFIQALRLITTFDWKNSILVVNANHTMSDEEVREAEKALESFNGNLPFQRCCSILTPYDPMSYMTYELRDTLIWSRFVTLAKIALEFTIGSIERETDVSKLFIANTKDYDVIITIKNEYLLPIPRWFKSLKVGGKSSIRGASYLCTEYKNVMMDRSRFLIGYNPERTILDCVRSVVGYRGVVMMNEVFGNRIMIAWKPSAFLPTAFSLQNLEYSCPVEKEVKNKLSKEDIMLVPNVMEMMKTIETMLGNVIESIEFK